MNDSQIRCILAVGESLNFTSAARDLFLSQSVLSRQVASFEAETGITVFDRTKKDIRLTPAGERLMAGLKTLKKNLEEDIRMARDVQAGISGHLRIGLVAGQTLGEVLPSILHYFSKELPYVKIDLEAMSFSKLRAALKQEKIDFAYLPQFEVENRPHIAFYPLRTTAHFLAVHRNHPRYQDEQLCLATLRDEPVLVVDDVECRPLFQDTWRKMAEEGIRIRVREIEDIGAKLLWIESGLAIGVVNEHNWLCHSKGVRTIPLPEVDIGPEVVAWHVENLNPVVPIFRAQLERALMDKG